MASDGSDGFEPLSDNEDFSTPTRSKKRKSRTVTKSRKRTKVKRGGTGGDSRDVSKHAAPCCSYTRTVHDRVPRYPCVLT